MKLTFKEYWESKEKLRESLLTSPIYGIKYSVKKYCKMFIGEGCNRISMNPNDIILIDWNYENILSPTPVSMTIKENIHIKDVTKLSSQKLRNWLSRNTSEEM